MVYKGVDQLFSQCAKQSLLSAKCLSEFWSSVCHLNVFSMFLVIVLFFLIFTSVKYTW